MKERVLLFGASGSGTTSLGKAAAKELGYRHVDTDDFFWLDVGTYMNMRPLDERLLLLRKALAAPGFIISGSLDGWGDSLIEYFDLAVFVTVDMGTRMDRLRQRERQRYGSRIDYGGDRYESSREFLNWAQSYDVDDGTSGRSRSRHLRWMEGLGIPIYTIDNSGSFEESLHRLISIIKTAK
ncbi:MAG: hypothetical protein E7328_06460 [Clostridiales bacterium]|nr:hypothetical protein [Clostridiales bacterium]